MIINIPLQLDDELISKAAYADYESKIVQCIAKHIETVLKNKANPGWSYGAKPEDGMRAFIKDAVDAYVEKSVTENKDTILESAAKELADRLARTKRGKEILEGIAE